MSKEVGINIELFQANVEKLSSSLTSLQTNLLKTKSFSNTNITPFTEDLQNVVKAMELLEKYKLILEADIITLKQTGESVMENDERVAKVIQTNTQKIN